MAGARQASGEKALNIQINFDVFKAFETSTCDCLPVADCQRESSIGTHWPLGALAIGENIEKIIFLSKIYRVDRAAANQDWPSDF